MGFKEIYLLGIDCNYNVGVKNHIVEYTTNVVRDAGYLMNESYKESQKYALKNGIKIINLNKGGNLDVFEKANIEDLQFN